MTNTDESLPATNMPDASAEPEAYGLNILKYLGLPQDYQPSPVHAPAQFLAKHMRSLPKDLLILFSPHINAKERTALPIIRNRRLRYFDSNPPEFSMPLVKASFASLWPGPLGNLNDVAKQGAKEEQEWADKEFLSGQRKQVGKLGDLLGTYEEEREAERARILRRQQREAEEALPEEDEDSDDEEDGTGGPQEELSPQEAEELFKRRLKERFIYGLLDVGLEFPLERPYYSPKFTPLVCRLRPSGLGRPLGPRSGQRGGRTVV